LLITKGNTGEAAARGGEERQQEEKRGAQGQGQAQDAHAEGG